MRSATSKQKDAQFVEALTVALAPAGEAVTVGDSEGYILSANDEVERVYRRTKKSLIGKHPLALCPKDFSPAFSKEIFDAVREKDAWDGIVINQDAEGRRFPILLRTVRVDFAGSSFIVSWARPFPEKAPFKLSGKQAQCFKLLGEGKTMGEIAFELKITRSSVETYLKRIKLAIAQAQLGAEFENRRDTIERNLTSIVPDITHLAVRCHEAGWKPVMKINSPLQKLN